MNGQMNNRWTVIDLFSGAGGMSYGFHIHPRFQVVGAVDAQIGKPSSGKGTLECNLTFKENIGIERAERCPEDESCTLPRQSATGVLGPRGLPRREIARW